jgi:hypothetical protein
MSEHESGGAPSKSNLEALYEKMSKAVRENLERAGALTEETLERALRESRDWASRLKEQYGEDIPKVIEYLRRDFQEAVNAARQQTRKSLDMDRIGAGILGFVQRMAQKAGSQLDSFASRLDERLTYKTGEVAGPGTLTCTQCAQQMHFSAASRIPPCPKCRNTTFRRSY